MVESGVLFSPGTAQLFRDIGKSDKLRDKAKKFVSSGKNIRKLHLSGHPNESLDSTSAACASAEILIGGIAQKKSHGERLFGENIKESIEIIKKFIKK